MDACCHHRAVLFSGSLPAATFNRGLLDEPSYEAVASATCALSLCLAQKQFKWSMSPPPTAVSGTSESKERATGG